MKRVRNTAGLALVVSSVGMICAGALAAITTKVVARREPATSNRPTRGSEHRPPRSGASAGSRSGASAGSARSDEPPTPRPTTAGLCLVQPEE